MRLTQAQVESLYAHGVAAYPLECCGLIVGPSGSRPGEPGNGDEILRLIPCRNIQDEMHAMDPQSYPRTARRAFLIDPIELERVLRQARESGEVLRGIFHSHPDEDAYFSKEDRDAAVPFGDVPSFPGAENLVMSVVGSGVRDCKVFRWDPVEKDFVHGTLEVKEDAS